MSDFKFENLEDFNQHVRSQLPWYDTAWDATTNVVKGFAQPDTNIYDIGSSTGYGRDKLSEIINQRNLTYKGLDPSAEFNRLNYGETWEGKAHNYPFEESSVCVSFLSMIFMTIPERHELMERIYDSLKPGGLFIFVERFATEGGSLSVAFHRSVQAMKDRSEGYDNFGKEIELLGIQQPMKLEEVWQPYQELQPFFRCFDFVGYAAIK